MIRIEKPRIELGTRLVSHVTNESMPFNEDL